MSKQNQVLYVDDAESNLLVVTISLDDMGIRVHSAKTALEGISKAREQAFSLILCDIHLPDVSGFEVLKSIRSIPGPNQFAPVIAFTADITIDNRLEIVRAGFTDFFSKPFKSKVLADNVGLYLDPLPGVDLNFSYYRQFMKESQHAALSRAISTDLQEFEKNFFLAWYQHDYETAKRQLHHFELLVNNLKLNPIQDLINRIRAERAITKNSSLVAKKIHRYVLALQQILNDN
jgi:CheY-like chemotaxis protein